MIVRSLHNSGRVPIEALTSASELADLVKGLVDGVEASYVTTAKRQNDIERLKGLILAAGKSNNNALSDIANFRGRNALFSTRGAELPSIASETTSQIARDTAASRQVRDTISKQSKKLVDTAQLNMSTKILEGKIALYKADEQDL